MRFAVALVLLLRAPRLQPLGRGTERSSAGKTPRDMRSRPGSCHSEIGPTSNVVWKTPSGPCVSRHLRRTDLPQRGWRRKTARDVPNRATGKVLWEAEVPRERLEEIHRIGSHAQCTPAVDGERVVSFFGSAGLYCHDTDGKLLWKRPMGPFKNTFCAGNSPLIVDDWIILLQDHDTDSFLEAIEQPHGQDRLCTDRSEFPRNYSTPMISAKLTDGDAVTRAVPSRR